ncbi:alkanesulfonate monooxygenase SsuD/methylene tetrahydromethanopterin reductase-like flavin-dependent oxidoreductase (luciferase family) [Actinocorallia herbida]|uniref:Alkanesulfonate monooxygenase SsuD/methylene tetrahydromethanopterin reductase-like flavin-dependent oxidoreductase (Luciferase family) n=1 Tax=Actinocorallia herbida TaxID=58109 RepID=A0A3N1CWX0_9ACTN|nr:LLM class flavin-dependent oxidoreductase [Actinocorallia herbida]ROO85790.1 alkanesulfonate monooxygenase SsuD/methylene tetrahydromethanopterin reductase-like flavin-dependent oxidoreductase (luciferase family) [Actinocorallia herbida]
MTRREGLHLALALEPGGWHPALRAAADPAYLRAGHWTDLVVEAEHGLLDFVTFDDVFTPGGPPTGRPDPALLAAAAAVRTRRVGLVTGAALTLTQPAHTASAAATLDHLSAGRAGIRVRPTARRADLDLFGLDDPGAYDLPVADLYEPGFVAMMDRTFGEAAEHVRAVRALWSGEPVDHAGARYRVRGQAASPRPLQGLPPVVALGHLTIPYRLGAEVADVLFVTPHDAAEARATLSEVRALQAEAGRADDLLHVFADLLVYLDETPGAAAARRERLDADSGAPSESDALIFTGTPADLTELLLAWHEAGLTGFRLRPGTVPEDLTAITRGVVPLLQKAGVFRTEYTTTTLRDHLALPPVP